MTRVKPPQPAASFPPEFARLWHHVHSTGERITIDNLGDSKGKYTSFRARMNAWRKANYEEALASGSEDRIRIANGLYSVSISNPYQENGQWKCDVRQRDGALGDKIMEKIGKDPMIQQHTPTTSSKEDKKPKADDAISSLYGKGEEE